MITLTINNQTCLAPASGLPYSVLAQIKVRLTFDNPAYLEAEKRGFYTGNLPQEIQGYQVERDALVIPRGFTRQLIGILQRAELRYRIDDRRRLLPEVDFTFRGQLRDFQETAVEAMASRDFGTLAAPTGSGKTVMALSLIARRRQPTLILVHTRVLMEQWTARAEAFLGIPAREVGIIGGGKRRIGEKVTVGMVKTLCKCASEIAPHIGNLVVDECHRAPARTFTQAVEAFDSWYMTGLSATPWRRDGLGRLIWWYLGDKVHEVDKEGLIESGDVLEAEVVARETNFSPTFNPSEEYSQMLAELTQDPARNAMIAQDVAREAGNGGGVCLVLSDRKAHCHTLVELLEARGITAAMLTADLSPADRRKVVEALNSGKVKVLVATGQLIGEGFDCRDLSTLFLATPVKFDGRLLQYLGRILRPAPGKEIARVFDYHDVNCGVLMAAAWARSRAYERH